MKYAIILLALLCSASMLISQDSESESLPALAFVYPAKADFLAVKDEENELLTADLALSSGFIDTEFVGEIDILPGIDQFEIDISTDYLKPLQYTVSNVEGIILDRGRFVGIEDLSFSRYDPGSYAVYVFAARKVVRAFVVEKVVEAEKVF